VRTASIVGWLTNINDAVRTSPHPTFHPLMAGQNHTL
jgi:hypothetical protein